MNRLLKENISILNEWRLTEMGPNALSEAQRPRSQATFAYLGDAFIPQAHDYVVLSA